ncbi:MAG: MFS transporter [Treponema sp.]|jgi:PPP family 3-phenylpropionic acid transporter|nr:MFS transporter [Treponema sp.]
MANLILAYVTSFFAYGAITPFLPLLVRDLGYSALFVGILLGVFEGAGIAGPFAFGFAADRTGNYKTPIVITYLVTALSVIPLAFFVHPALSVVFIVFFAFSFRATSPLLDAAATIFIGASGNYGRLRAAGSLSFIVMVLFLQWGPFLKPDSAVNISFWIALSSIAAIVPALFMKNASVGRKTSGERKMSETNRPGGSVEARFPRRIWTPLFFGGLSVIFLCRLAMSAVYTFFPLYLTEYLRWNVVGAMFALATACEVPCMFVSARLIRRFGPLPLLALSAAAISVRLGIYALFPAKAFIVAAQGLHALCFGIFHPAAVGFIAESVPPEKRALGMSIYLSLGSGLPSLVGNVLGGIIVERSGYSRLFAVYSLFTLAAAAVFFVIRAAGRVTPAAKPRNPGLRQSGL